MRAEAREAVLGLLREAGDRGLNVKQVCGSLHVHHGTGSGLLSNLHKADQIKRLSEKRKGCKIYVLPEHVNGRTTEAQGRAA